MDNSVVKLCSNIWYSSKALYFHLYLLNCWELSSVVNFLYEMYAVCSDAEMNNSRSFVFVKVDKQMLVAYLIMFWMCVVGCACVCVCTDTCLYICIQICFPKEWETKHLKRWFNHSNRCDMKSNHPFPHLAIYLSRKPLWIFLFVFSAKSKAGTRFLKDFFLKPSPQTFSEKDNPS